MWWFTVSLQLFCRSPGLYHGIAFLCIHILVQLVVNAARFFLTNMDCNNCLILKNITWVASIITWAAFRNSSSFLTVNIAWTLTSDMFVVSQILYNYLNRNTIIMWFIIQMWYIVEFSLNFCLKTRFMYVFYQISTNTHLRKRLVQIK